jgi:hypothetical protein
MYTYRAGAFHPLLDALLNCARAKEKSTAVLLHDMP